MKTVLFPLLLVTIFSATACRRSAEAPGNKKAEGTWELREMITGGFSGRIVYRPGNNGPDRCNTEKPTPEGKFEIPCGRSYPASKTSNDKSSRWQNRPFYFLKATLTHCLRSRCFR